MKLIHLSDALTAVTRVETACKPDYSDFIPAEVKQEISKVPEIEAVEVDALLAEAEKDSYLGEYVALSALRDIINKLKGE